MPAGMSFDQLQDYLARFRDAFRRRDQARWADVYCQGLLLDLPRKNVETLARHVSVPPGLGVENVTQALHNFLNQSPWDEGRLWRRYRALLAARLGRPDGVFVLDEVVFPKQGEHSVGVQRQYSSARGEKLNCQLAAAVHYVSAAGCGPLALRLYLPAGWLASAQRLDAAGVPAECRHRLAKGQLALQLLDEVRGGGFPGSRVVASAGAGAVPHLLDGLAQRGLPGVVEAGPDVTVFPEWPGRPQRLGDLVRQLRWEGGTASLPLESLADREAGTARTVRALVERRGRDFGFALTNLPADVDGPAAARLWRSLPLARQGAQRLRDLGLDHFEGRSWRGFHHHACLVALAYGFLLWQEGEGGV
jgi:SRSO17 transposase